MRFAEPARRGGVLAALLAGLAALAGCGTMDDLLPSGRDRRPGAEPGTVGPAVGQIAPDFTLPDTLGREVSLHAELGAARGAVLYFTMWCPICDADMTEMRAGAVVAFPDVRFFAVDYVSAGVAEARAAQLASGWDGPAFTVLADAGAAVESFYAAPMALVVIGRDRVVRLRGGYDGARLRQALEALP